MTQNRMDMRERGLASVVEHCQQEQRSHRSDTSIDSPWCVEIFRRAFYDDQDAWAAIWEQFQGHMRLWVPASAVDVEDVVQDGFANFARGAPKVPPLIASDQLGPVLTYLRTCVKRAAIHNHRKQGRQEFYPLDEQLAAPVQTEELVEQKEQSGQILAHVHTITTAVEFLVFQQRALQAMTPQQILEQYPDQFADMTELRTIIQRVFRRLEKDSVIQSLLDRATPSRQKNARSRSLEIRMLDTAKDDGSMGAPCLFDDSQLIDYLTNAAPADARQAIESSPACLEAAARLAETVLPLMSLMYRAECPDTDTIVGYQGQQLQSTAQLIVHAHIATCALCQAEIDLLRAIDRTSLVPAPSFIRRMVEAVFQPALAKAVRGPLLRYQTPTITVHLGTRKTSGSTRAWNVRGEVRTHDGERIIDSLESASLRPIELLSTDEIQEYTATIESTGDFVFRMIPPGIYQLHLITPEEEILIRRIEIDSEV